MKHWSGWLLGVVLLAACQQVESPTVTPLRVPTPTVPAPPLVLTPAIVSGTSTEVGTTVATTQLFPGEHISASGSYTLTETEAAGPMACHIQRGSSAFGHLAGLQDDNIIFNQWEDAVSNSDNRLMHIAMVKSLLQLRDLTLREWPDDTKVLVTAAYDSSLLDHALSQPVLATRYSLHFEGRSLDVVPFPAKPERLGRFCWLAHEAGFDWAYNENDHCHVSTRAQSLCELYNPMALP